MALAAGCVTDVELTRAPGGISAAGGRWRAVESGTTRDLHRVWGSGPGDVWAVGDGGTAVHWDGLAWSTVATNTTASLTGVWGADRNDVWAVGAGPPGAPGLIHWDGTRWTEVPLSVRDPVMLRAIWGSGAGDVWAVGGAPDAPGPSVWRRGPSGWRPESVSGARAVGFTGIEGRGVQDLWLVGRGPLLVHQARGEWLPPVTAPPGVVLGGSLCVTSDGAVWVTAAGDAIHRLRGASWTRFALAPGAALRGLWCGSADDVWGVGDGGRISHWDGAAWTSEAVGGADLAAVWDSDAGERWAVGARGAVLRFGR